MSADISHYQARIENVLEALLHTDSPSERLIASMRYSTLGGGKRIRALLVYGAGTAVGAEIDKLDTVAAALECIHSYSLIHDDLPAMDDDDLRRGKATNHIHYDEATAILAGDALLNQAFEILSAADSGFEATQAITIIRELAQASGKDGMVGGQMLDILATQSELALEQLEHIHRYKTGALIRAAVVCGALCNTSVTENDLNALRSYAEHIGLAFQVVDDILDVESSTDVLGKPAGSDQSLGKSTYPALIGLEESKQLAKNLYHQSIESLAHIRDNSGLLLEIADLVIHRVH